MSQDNQITLRGFVTAEPKFFTTVRAGTMGAEVRIGSTARWLNRNTGEWQEGEPTYYTVKCWRKLAVNVKASLHKGDRVIVRGKFSTRTWTDEQQHPRVNVEVEADTIGHDLLFGVSIFNRIQAPRNVSEDLANGEMARAGLDDLDGHAELGRDDLPPLPDAPDDYSQDGFTETGAGSPFAMADTLSSQDLGEEADSEEAEMELAAEALPI